MRASLADRPGLPQTSASTPGAGASGMAGRRIKPGLRLSDMKGFGAGAQAAGLALGRPASPTPARRALPQGELGTPFANFRKIV